MGSYFLPVGLGVIRDQIAQGLPPLLLLLSFGCVVPWAPPLAHTPTARLQGSDWNEGPDPEERVLRTPFWSCYRQQNPLIQPLLPPPPQQGSAEGRGWGPGLVGPGCCAVLFIFPRLKRLQQG